MSDTDAPGDLPAAFDDRLDDVAAELDEAETEADLDEVEASLDEIETDLEGADLPESPEPEDDDEEELPDPRDELEDRIDELRDDLEEQRGPYAEDVISDIESAATTIRSTEWADEGKDELVAVVDSFLDEVASILDRDLDSASEPDPDTLAESLDRAAEAVDGESLHPDDDTPAIDALLEATEELNAGIEESTAFGDLPVREQLNRRGFFDVLGHYKDFPPEWSAIKAHESERNTEMILLAFDLLDSNYLEEHCVDSLRRLGDPAALDDMMGLANRRDKAAIEVLGKIGDPEPVDMLLDYADTESDPLLQQASLKALGEIGDSEATHGVAQQLDAEDQRVRSGAARALGMIGDTRAIDPLIEVLETDSAEPVRGSAAWALLQIGTETAHEALAEYREDASFLVEAEARNAIL